jgi:hypothetical protein
MIRNAATSEYEQPMSLEGFTAPTYLYDIPPYTDMKNPTAIPVLTREELPREPSHHLSRGDGTPYYDHNASR